ncbi:uncharacterized protein LOC123530101 [Mercenaria mercenaria]|uniref:uncharacterized protein LOC123530101 n=1 Tax=Mercenaria mercenaria TaxID=6596 RepID=UPI00234E6E2B|nr:uncharacterized protein LOC123530101 [Mercenaria mercenaria]
MTKEEFSLDWKTESGVCGNWKSKGCSIGNTSTPHTPVETAAVALEELQPSSSLVYPDPPKVPEEEAIHEGEKTKCDICHRMSASNKKKTCGSIASTGRNVIFGSIRCVLVLLLRLKVIWKTSNFSALHTLNRT